MFNSVSHAGDLVLVREASHSYVHAGTGSVGLGIVDQEHFKLVRQFDATVFSFVVQGLFEVVGDSSNSCHPVELGRAPPLYKSNADRVEGKERVALSMQL